MGRKKFAANLAFDTVNDARTSVTALGSPDRRSR
jgi:hypothetical protein